MKTDHRSHPSWLYRTWGGGWWTSTLSKPIEGMWHESTQDWPQSKGLEPPAGGGEASFLKAEVEEVLTKEKMVGRATQPEAATIWDGKEARSFEGLENTRALWSSIWRWEVGAGHKGQITTVVFNPRVRASKIQQLCFCPLPYFLANMLF